MGALVWIFAKGFATSAVLIIAIGAQNAFVLRQGLKGEHVLAVAAICALSDALLIVLGIAGVGTAVQSMPTLLAIARYGGAAFLFGYGLLAAKRAMTASAAALTADDARSADSSPMGPGARGAGAGALKRTVLTCLAFTYLNPHVYLDTVVLLGSLSAQYGSSRWLYGAGAVSASIVWFFGLAYGARLLAPLFAKPVAWRVLDGLIALVMFGLALGLLLGAA